MSQGEFCAFIFFLGLMTGFGIGVFVGRSGNEETKEKPSPTAPFIIDPSWGIPNEQFQYFWAWCWHNTDTDIGKLPREGDNGPK
jgi:hypothetical protein